MTGRGTDVRRAGVAPFYLLFDVSWSMEKEMPGLNDALRELKNTMLSDPLLADIARVSLITFSSSARVVLPMQDLAGDWLIGSTDILQPEDGTSFAAAFRLLREQINFDVASLKAEDAGRAVYRPMVFFLTDGDPLADSESEWKQALNDLTSNNPYPNILPLGFGDVNADVLAQCTYPKNHAESFYLIAKDGVPRGQSIAAIVQIIKNSVVSTAKSAADGVPRVVIEKAGTEGVLAVGRPLDTV